jgi:hypothetical protein
MESINIITKPQVASINDIYDIILFLIGYSDIWRWAFDFNPDQTNKLTAILSDIKNKRIIGKNINVYLIYLSIEEPIINS